MSLQKILLTTTLVAGLALAGCASDGQGGINKQTGGTAVGAVLGGLAGAQFGKGRGQLVTTGLGVLLGALAGSEVGKSLDRADHAYMNQAQNRAYSAPVGQTITWSNPESGNYGSYTPLRDGHTSSGAHCREYKQTIYVDGRQETAKGTACQNPDGTWHTM